MERWSWEWALESLEDYFEDFEDDDLAFFDDEALKAYLWKEAKSYTSYLGNTACYKLVNEVFKGDWSQIVYYIEKGYKTMQQFACSVLYNECMDNFETIKEFVEEIKREVIRRG